MFRLFRSGVGCIVSIICIIIAIIIVILLVRYLNSNHFVDSLYSFKGEIDNWMQSTTVPTNFIHLK